MRQWAGEKAKCQHWAYSEGRRPNNLGAVEFYHEAYLTLTASGLFLACLAELAPL